MMNLVSSKCFDDINLKDGRKIQKWQQYNGAHNSWRRGLLIGAKTTSPSLKSSHFTPNRHEQLPPPKKPVVRKFLDSRVEFEYYTPALSWVWVQRFFVLKLNSRTGAEYSNSTLKTYRWLESQSYLGMKSLCGNPRGKRNTCGRQKRYDEQPQTDSADFHHLPTSTKTSKTNGI